MNDGNTSMVRNPENPENDNRVGNQQINYPRREMTVIIEEPYEASFIHDNEQQNNFNFQDFLKDLDDSIEKKTICFDSVSKLNYSEHDLEILSL